MAIVYQHIRLDTNTVFYIGIGSQKKRAYSNCKRSKYWHSIVNKAGYAVELLHENIEWDKACEIEQLLIRLYGRKDLGLGQLVNMTNGGDGRFGAVISEITKKKMSDSRKGKSSINKGRMHTLEAKLKMKQHFETYGSLNKGKAKSEETKKKISQSLKKRANNNWTGRKHSEESKLKMKISHGSGENNPRYGTNHSDETIKKMEIAAKKRAKITCPHCKKEGQNSAMQRWHFNNCKNK